MYLRMTIKSIVPFRQIGSIQSTLVHFIKVIGVMKIENVSKEAMSPNRILAATGQPTIQPSFEDPRSSRKLVVRYDHKICVALHHEANGVTERLNQTIENYLRAFTNGPSDDWDSYLALAEFAYNSRFHQAISMTPFEVDLGYLSSTPATPFTPPRATGAARQRCALKKTFLEPQVDRLATVRRELQWAADRMSNYPTHPTF
ncbi:unnamed protein product [Phytophthora fragariaefolia]|uniref:Unnamed protein product n=1 Tax=Phytophthora fragariaefolia TaxID=1490495 RepID=A0A9W6TQP6_9STRA|nr:unnamed protein product [Phytophthora fragariaefolia]